ncbi:MAG TPA: class I SAM-dependent rRNA methyltransferase, partial [Pirellulales bacterium]|nr:class I SAM-dependent rRNA methyltransferase [Pirellulales bacterium]
DLYSDRGQWVARGCYNRHSRIRVRLYSWVAEQALDTAFWASRLKTAIDLRRQLGYLQPAGVQSNSGARLVFSEADGLSGLLLDRFDEYLVLQVTSLAMARRLPELTALVRELVPYRGLLLKTDRDMSRSEGMTLEDRLVDGVEPDGPVFIEEHGVRFGVDLSGGQKTGFFLDQRQNRLAAAQYCTGRRVLDLCCYTGGFGLVAAAVGQAREVLGIDSSQKAITLARANAQLNGLARVHFEAADCFERLESLAAEGERFGAVVLDPPKFARSRTSVEDALRAYHHLNRLAISVLEPGGVLITCSCSGHVSREDFAFMLADVAQRTGREIQLLEQRGAAPDHPVAATCMESDYLKCCICRVV